MERRRPNRAYVELLSRKKDARRKHKHKQLQKENLLHHRQSGEEESNSDVTSTNSGFVDATASPPPVSDAFNSLHRSRSMRASFRLLKDKLHQTRQNAFQTPFKLHTHLSSRTRKCGDNVTVANKTTAARLLDELDAVAALTRPMLRQRHANQVDGDDVAGVSATARQLCEPQERIAATRRVECKTAEIERLMAGLPLSGRAEETNFLAAQLRVPRKACKLLQIPESYCLKYLSEQQRSAELKTVGKVSVTETSVKATIATTIVNQKSTHWTDIAVQGTMTVTDGQEQDFEEKNLLQIGSDGIYGTTRMRTATIRKPVPYLNSRRYLNTIQYECSLVPLCSMKK